jgi:FHS family L-fucose permease-like MFS transporter
LTNLIVFVFVVTNDYSSRFVLFPTIFALGVKGMGSHTKQASSLLVMCIVGGAVFPICMGALGQDNMALGFILPLISFAYIAAFGVMHAIDGKKTKSIR